MSSLLFHAFALLLLPSRVSLPREQEYKWRSGKACVVLPHLLPPALPSTTFLLLLHLFAFDFGTTCFWVFSCKTYVLNARLLQKAPETGTSIAC